MMTNKMYRALMITSLSMAALVLAANDASAGRAGSAAPVGGAFAAAPRAPIAHSFRNNRGQRFFGGGAFWPGGFWPQGDGFNGSVGGGPIANIPPIPESTDINYT